MSTLTFELARQTYAVRGTTERQAERLRGRFGNLHPPETPTDTSTIIVERRADDTSFMKRPPGPTEYRLDVRYDDRTVRVAGVGFCAEIDRGSLDAHMTTCHEDAWFLDGFENLFRIVASYRSFEAGAMVLHSAAFTDGQRGFLCCGRSGAGKTTLAGLAHDLGLKVLSDELNLVSTREGAFQVQAMPFAGDFGRTRVGGPPLPLSALLGLRQSAIARIGECSRAEAVSRIVASCPYLNADPACVDQVTDRAAELARHVPLRVLSFAPDTSFWKVLDHEYAHVADAISP